MSNNYSGAAAWCEQAEERENATADFIRTIALDEYDKPKEREEAAQAHEANAAHATVALRAVRAWEALRDERVTLTQRISGTWQAERVDTGFIGTAPDPLDAITLAMEAGDA